MNSLEALHEIEAACGVSFPAGYTSTVGDFHAFTLTSTFRRGFPSARLLLSPSEFVAARCALPENLLPFMFEHQPTHIDYYAFDLAAGSPEPRVVAWAIHAVVFDWPTFPDFRAWAAELAHRNALPPVRGDA